MKATDIRSIVVAGAGTMGASMAQIFAKYGYTVTLYDIAEAAIQRGRDLVRVNQESQVKSGDLTAQQIDRMTFCPVAADTDAQAVLSYLPIYENRVEPAAVMTLSIRGKEDKAPAAQDSAVETV